MRFLAAIVAAVAVCSAPAQAQVACNGAACGSDGTAVNLSALCQAIAAIPPSEVVGGSAGTGNACRLANAVQPRITRAGLATADANGNWSILWTTPLPSAPATLPIPMNSGTQPIDCNVATSTTTGATGQCWVARTLPATLLTVGALINYNLFGASASGTVVQVFAIPVTQ